MVNRATLFLSTTSTDLLLPNRSTTNHWTISAKLVRMRATQHNLQIDSHQNWATVALRPSAVFPHRDVIEKCVDVGSSSEKGGPWETSATADMMCCSDDRQALVTWIEQRGPVLVKHHISSFKTRVLEFASEQSRWLLVNAGDVCARRLSDLICT